MKKECENGEDKNDKNIYASMARMSDNDKCPSRNFGDSLQLKNRILYSGPTCHMAPEVSYFIPGLLVDADKHIEMLDKHHMTAGTRMTSKNKKCVTIM